LFHDIPTLQAVAALGAAALGAAALGAAALGAAALGAVLAPPLEQAASAMTVADASASKRRLTMF
jgi:hypothetical protein